MNAMKPMPSRNDSSYLRFTVRIRFICFLFYWNWILSASTRGLYLQSSRCARFTLTLICQNIHVCTVLLGNSKFNAKKKHFDGKIWIIFQKNKKKRFNIEKIKLFLGINLIFIQIPFRYFNFRRFALYFQEKNGCVQCAYGLDAWKWLEWNWQMWNSVRPFICGNQT